MDEGGEVAWSAADDGRINNISGDGKSTSMGRQHDRVAR